MVHIVHGNIFASNKQTLVNPVNCVGVMGAGLAREFRRRFPGMYKDYLTMVALGKVRPGVPYIYKELLQPWIINFPTKYHFREMAMMEYIERGLCYIIGNYRKWKVTSLAVPALGCGLGGLDWSDVKPVLVAYLSELDIPVDIYAPVERDSLGLW
ncbi:MAG: macro domain-containing protein [Candidatus Methanomethylicaceae archaeon]